MTADLLSIIIRVGILFLLTICSELVINMKSFGVGFFLFSIWVSFFRMTLYRAMSSYIGLFGHEEAMAKELSTFILSSNSSNYTDALVLIGTISLFISLRSAYKKQRKGVK